MEGRNGEKEKTRGQPWKARQVKIRHDKTSGELLVRVTVVSE